MLLSVLVDSGKVVCQAMSGVAGCPGYSLSASAVNACVVNGKQRVCVPDHPKVTLARQQQCNMHHCH